MNGPQTPATEDRLATLDRRVEHLETLMSIALGDELKAIRTSSGIGDACSAAILRLTSDWVHAGELKTAVRRFTGDSESTIKRRIAELVKAGALEADGAKQSQVYRNTYLFG